MEHLEIYQAFLGEEEFQKVKENYLKTCNTMNLLYKLELERLKISDDLIEEITERKLMADLEKFEYILEVTAGKGRE